MKIFIYLIVFVDILLADFAIFIKNEEPNLTNTSFISFRDLIIIFVTILLCKLSPKIFRIKKDKKKLYKTNKDKLRKLLSEINFDNIKVVKEFEEKIYKK